MLNPSNEILECLRKGDYEGYERDPWSLIRMMAEELLERRRLTELKIEEMKMNNLKFTQLRTANALRVRQFRNAKGELAHPHGEGNWALSQWSNAAAGEMGETCNLVKKIERGDYTLD